MAAICQICSFEFLKPQHFSEKENKVLGCFVFACFVSNVWHNFPLAGKECSAFFRQEEIQLCWLQGCLSLLLKTLTTSQWEKGGRSSHLGDSVHLPSLSAFQTKQQLE